MNFNLMKEVLMLAENYESQKKSDEEELDLEGFKKWVCDNYQHANDETSPNSIKWEGREKGRNEDSAISTLLVHLNRYAKNYSKSAISDSPFSTQDDFIYLISLRAFGTLPKTELIKKNVHEKPAGILIINRLINLGFVRQLDSEEDGRKKVVEITESGDHALNRHMGKIRLASQIVSGNLNFEEKLQLIKILQKLNGFHLNIYNKNVSNSELLGYAQKQLKTSIN